MTEDSQQTFKNPFLLLWNILGSIGGVLSLSSMAQTWVSDLVVWRGFVLTLIESYRSIVRPIFEFIFSWLPFHIPFWVHDYLVLGAIIAISEHKAGSRDSLISDVIFFFIYNWRQNQEGFGLSNINYNTVKRSRLTVIKTILSDLFFDTLFWPLVVAVYPNRIFLFHKRKKRSTFVRHNPKILFTYRASLWFGAIMLGTVVLFSVNATL